MGQLPGIGFEVLAQGTEGAVAAVADRDDEVGAGEDHDLAGVDDLAGRGQLGVLDIGDGLEDGEEDVAVLLDLGTLVGVDGVLDGERVQTEQFRDAGDLRLARFVQAQPDEAAPALADLPYGVLHRFRFRPAETVAVDDAVDRPSSRAASGPGG
ncbi:hypothetical protein SPURM210S_04100 [Streptomyces purpurascens]